MTTLIVSLVLLCALVVFQYRVVRARRLFEDMVERVSDYLDGVIALSQPGDFDMVHSLIKATFNELSTVSLERMVFNYRSIRPENFWSEDFLERIS